MLNKKGKRELAYIVRVLGTENLPGYDRVHQVSVLGWKCVASKEINAGDLAIYFEIDSLLPEDDKRFDFMAPRKHRVRTQRMCKTLSQGLVLPLKDFPECAKLKEGDFVTDLLKVRLYDPECDSSSAESPTDLSRYTAKHKRFFSFPLVKFMMRYGWFRKVCKKLLGSKKDKNRWPDWLPKTGSERIQNLPHLFNSEDTYIVTEKVDGTSTSFVLTEKDKYMVCSHNVVKPLNEADGGKYFSSNVWVKSGTKYDMENLLRSLKTVHDLKTVAIQGETYGDRVQKRTYGLKGTTDFVVFHVWFDGKRLPVKEMIKICEDHKLPHVHVYDYDYRIPKSVEEIVGYVDSCKSAIDNGEIEGFVFYSQDGQQNFKCVSPNFLLKYH